MDTSGIAIACVVGLLAYNEISALKKTIRRQEERIDQLAKRIGQEDLSSDWVSDELKAEVIELKQAGKTIEAIKKVREHTKMGLAEAKQYVDSLEVPFQ